MMATFFDRIFDFELLLARVYHASKLERGMVFNMAYVDS